MNNLIIFTIGNRDLQFRREDVGILEKKFKLSFKINNENKDYFVIDKSKGNFLDYTKLIYENFDFFKDYVVFPLIDRTLRYFKDKNLDFEKLVFCVTKQEPLDKQDTFYVGEIIKNFFSKFYDKIEVKYIKKSPVDSEYLFDFFRSILDEFRDYEVYVSYSGGTPLMRSIFLLSGIFRSNVRFGEIKARNNSFDFKNYLVQKRYLLRDKIEDMLTVYDFEGVRRLPVGKEIVKLCDLAIKRYNFEVLSDEKIEGYVNRAKEGIKLLYSNLVVCYVQGRYAEVIGRIFRIEEAIGQYFFYFVLKERGLVNEKDKVARIKADGDIAFEDSYERFLKNMDKEHYKSLFLEKFDDVFIEFNEDVFFSDESFSKKNGRLLSYRIGKNFFYFLFRSLNLHKEVYSFFEKVNDNYSENSKLNELRNRSINGHGFNGISLKDLEGVFGDFDDFLVKFKELLERYVIKEKFENVFDVYVDKIKNVLR